MNKHERLWLAVLVVSVVTFNAQPDGFNWRLVVYGALVGFSFFTFVRGERAP